MDRLDKELKKIEEEKSYSDMRVELDRDYYQIMKKHEANQYIFEPEMKGMYHFKLHKDYYSEDDESVLYDIICDLEEEIEMLKEIYKNRYEEQYKSIGKRIKKDEWER